MKLGTEQKAVLNTLYSSEQHRNNNMWGGGVFRLWKTAPKARYREDLKKHRAIGGGRFQIIIFSRSCTGYPHCKFTELPLSAGGFCALYGDFHAPFKSQTERDCPTGANFTLQLSK